MVNFEVEDLTGRWGKQLLSRPGAAAGPVFIGNAGPKWVLV